MPKKLRPAVDLMAFKFRTLKVKQDMRAGISVFGEERKLLLIPGCEPQAVA
jgi:hypothetical protein